MGSIDQRIVDMQFNNKQFESGVQTSLKSLDNLKKGLDLEGASKGLTNLDKAGKSFSLAGIASGVDSIASKFSTLGIIGITALQNITNSAINAGKQLVKSLTIDPIKTGFNEYETKMNAIQTILTNTESKGTTLNEVNSALDELNVYADKTIYNFAQMTDNVGKFTAAGLGLKDSVTTVKGLSNVAAGFGVDATKMAGATYQMSQALSAGVIKLIDWKSMEQASMGGEKIQKALKETAKEMGIFVDESIPFRETLESGWLTSEVFVKTMDKMAKDKSLLAAAQNVTSFTKLIGVMQESVQSGWAQTWEIIIGNKDESTKFFTELSNGFTSLIGPSVDARNSMFTFWRDNGGREAIIQSLLNAFNGLMGILKPIKEAFREFFPAMTGQRLVEISNGIRDLTANFKIGEGTAENLKRTFKGFFALLDIGKQAFVALGEGLKPFFKDLVPAGNDLLSTTAKIGDFFVSLDETAKRTEIFKKAITKVSEVIKTVSDEAKIFVQNVINAFKGFANVDLSGVDSFTERVRLRFEPFSALGEFIHNVFSKIAGIIQAVAPIFYKLAGIMGKAFDNMRKNIVDALDNAEFDSIYDIINSGIFAGILLGLKKFIDSISNISDNAGGFLDGIKGILDGVKGSLEAYQSQLKANTLMTIAIAIGVLAAALIALSLIDSKKLTVALAAMTTMFIELFGSMAAFEKVMGGAGFQSLGKVTAAMMGLSVAVLILSVAMTNLAKLDWPGLAKGLVGVGTLCAMLVVSAKGISENSKGLIKGSLGLILFAAAINILVAAVQKLGALDAKSLTKGLIGVGVIMAELVLFMKTSGTDKMGVLKGVGLIALATAVTILAEAVEKFSQINSTSLLKGLGALTAVLAELAIFVNVTGNAKNVISTGIGLTILGAAMLIFAQAIGQMGSMSLKEIGKGLLAMGGALAIIIAAMSFMPKGMILQATGLVIIASALVILSNALSNMGGMSWEEIGKGLVALAGSLTIIAIAMIFMQSALPGAAALLIIAAALAVLTPCLQTLGSMSLGEIGKGLLALAGIFAVLGVAGLVLGPLTPVILALAGAVALFGIGIAAVGVGMLAFATGLTALSVAGAAGVTALTAIVMAVVGLIPEVLKAFAEGIIDFIRVLGEGAPVVAEAVQKIILSIIDTINIIAPKALDCLASFLTKLLAFLVDMIPKMVDAGMKLILGILRGVAEHIQEVTEAGIDVILGFLEGVITKLPAIVDTAFRVIISFINGLADAITNNHQALYDAVGNLIGSIIDAIIDLIPMLIDVGKDLIQGLIDGVVSMGQALWDGVCSIASNAIDGVKNLLGIKSPSRVFAKIGEYTIQGFIVGIKRFSKGAVDAAKDVGDKSVKSLTGAISRVSDVVNSEVDMNPTIRPVLDLSNVHKGAKRLAAIFSRRQAVAIDDTSMTHNPTTEVQNGSKVPSGDKTIYYTQNNYSPKALSRLDIYRQTKNQISTMKGLVDA